MDSTPDYIETLEPHKPGRQGWAGVVLSILICTLAAAALFFGSAALRSLIAHQKLSAAVYGHSWSPHVAQRDFEQILAYRSWLTTLHLGHFFPTTAMPELALTKLKIAQDSSSAGKEKAALQTVTEALREIEFNPYSGDTFAKCPLLRQAFTSAKQEVEKSKSDIDSLSQAQTSFTLHSEENQRLKSRYLLLKQSLETLLGLPSENGEPFYSFYSKGVLQGLPELSHVPENVSAFSELSSILAGFNGPRMSDELLLSLINIRQQSEPLAAELGANEVSLSQAKSELENVRGAVKGSYKNIMLKTSDLFLAAISIGLRC